MSDVTRLLDAAAAGDRHAAAELLPLVYDELRSLAAAQMQRERPGHTLNATALVHEAYLRLVASGGGNAPGNTGNAPGNTGNAPGNTGNAPGNTGNNWNGRGHFFAAAAEAMRRILIDAARR